MKIEDNVLLNLIEAKSKVLDIGVVMETYS